MNKVLFFLLLILLTPKLIAQTCCSGGVPMASNIGLPSSEKGTWQFSLSYDLNVLETLKDGKTVLDDDTRKRTTKAILSQIGYTVSDKVSVDLFLSHIQQIRELSPIGLPTNSDETTGLGDAVLLLKYKFYKNYQIGIGVKAPLGDSDKRNSIGLRLGADLQPGSGSWDMLYWFNGSESLKFRKSMALSGTIIYRVSGENKNYLGSQVYKFGNEFQAIIGIGDRFVIGSKTIDPSISFKYRKSVADQTNANNSQLREVPSTGGEWIFIRPAVSLNLNSTVSLQTTLELPIYANLVNTQVTPTYRVNIGAFITLKKQKILNP